MRAILIGAILTACVDATAPVPQNVRVLPEWVTGDAAAALDPLTGRFRLPANPTYLGKQAAETLAVAVAKLFASPYTIGNTKAVLEADRGGPIDFSVLRLCERPTYAISPYSELPAGTSSWVRRAFGSHWAIPLCGPDQQAQLSVGIPDNITDARVVDGSIVLPTGSGQHFSLVGVPSRFPTGLPLTPEEAVAAVVAATGRRIASVPVAFNQLDYGGSGQFPLCASWRIRLDGSASMIEDATGAVIAVQELFVHHAPACFSPDIVMDAASPDPPPTRWFVFLKDGALRDSLQLEFSGPVMFRRLRPSR